MSVSPPFTPLSYGRTHPLSGRPCPLVNILSRCLPALRLPSSAPCANWPTVDKCIKVNWDYNWSLRINYTRWNSDMITQLMVRAVRRDRWSWKILRSASITIAIFLGKNSNFCNPVPHVRVRAHTCERTHTYIPLTCFVHRRLYHMYKLINSVVWCYKSWPEWWTRCNKQGQTNTTSYQVKHD